MAEAPHMSEREWRYRRRKQLREELLNEGLSERLQGEDRCNLELPTDDQYEANSIYSDLGTIDEYLHQSTIQDIRELEQSKYGRLSTRSQAVPKHSEGLIGIDESFLKVQDTMRQLKACDDERPESETKCRSVDRANVKFREREQVEYPEGEYIRYESRRRSVENFLPERGEINENIERYLNDGSKGIRQDRVLPSKADSIVKQRYCDDRKEVNSGKEEGVKEREIKSSILRMRQEYDEIRSQSARFETESLKLRKLKLEEDRKSELIKDHAMMLKKETELKQKAEEELIIRIAEFESEELRLNQKRNENEDAEHQLKDLKSQDQAMTSRLEALRQKENELLRRRKMREMKDTEKGNPKEKIQDTKYSNKDSSVQVFKLGMPKIPDFDGKHFEQWRFEITCLLKAGLYPEYALGHAVRNSLKGDTRQILLTLQPTASTRDILKKLEDIYGNVKTPDKIIQDFYSAKQKSSESCSEWAVRLEALFQLALEKGEVDESTRDRKLMERFWRGLYSDKLKADTRVSYESSDSFEKLRRKVRLEEEEEIKDGIESKVGLDKGNVQVQQHSSAKKEIDENVLLLKDLVDRMKSMEGEIEKMRERDTDRKFRRDTYQRGRRSRGGYRYGNFDRRSHQRNKPEPDQKETNKSDDKDETEHLNRKMLSPRGSVKADKK